MKYIDVFNGDADGLCALVQLRRAKPVDSMLITGVKRDIQLLKRVDSACANSAQVTVLDVSYEKNAEEVSRLLDSGATVDYFDHHQTGKVLKHKGLTLNVNLSADVCTALIVDAYLEGRYRAWAITGAFGDNLTSIANQLATQFSYAPEEVGEMKSLGHLLNYNAYGDTIADLYYSPTELFETMQNFDEPFSFAKENREIVETLASGYASDFSLAVATKPMFTTSAVEVYVLPNDQWTKRVSGVFGNHLANQAPDKAHAVLRRNANGTYVVSIRAPLLKKQGADVVASQFPTGGGRKAAAGINALSEDDLGAFCRVLDGYYSS